MPFPIPASSPRRPQSVQDAQLEQILANAARLSMILIGGVVGLAALHIGQVILAPVALAVVVGLMFGPVADALERRHVPPALSAGVVVLLFVALIGLGVVLFAMPLSEWIGRAPAIWEKLRHEFVNLKEPLQGLANLQEQVKGMFGDEGGAMPVTVEDGSDVASMAMLAPTLGAHAAIFLASLYFFLATREHIRVSILSVCVSRRMRWRAAHIFRDVEQKVSRFLLSVSLLNFGVGVAVGLSMWAIGMPSPVLWGALAAVLNFIPYVGQAVMVVILLAVGLGTQTGLEHILLPVGCYLVINFFEGQIITPHFIGHTLTLNPFLIFLSITFWLWAWGPVGGLIAVPMLLIITSVLGHVLPSRPVMPKRPVRPRPGMTEKELVLANAAQAVREKAEAEHTAADPEKAETPEARRAERIRRRTRPPRGTAPTGANASQER